MRGANKAGRTFAQFGDDAGVRFSAVAAKADDRRRQLRVRNRALLQGSLQGRDFALVALALARAAFEDLHRHGTRVREGRRVDGAEAALAEDTLPEANVAVGQLETSAVVRSREDRRREELRLRERGIGHRGCLPFRLCARSGQDGQRARGNQATRRGGGRRGVIGGGRVGGVAAVSLAVLIVVVLVQGQLPLPQPAQEAEERLLPALWRSR